MGCWEETGGVLALGDVVVEFSDNVVSGGSGGRRVRLETGETTTVGVGFGACLPTVGFLLWSSPSLE